VDVRLVAATNQLLEDLVERQRFRADLYYRLNVARIDLPPLRERREDVPTLFQAVIVELNQREGRRVGAPSADLLDCLMAHPWPGNVRELRNLAEAIFIDPPEGAIGFDDLPPAFRKLFQRYRRADSRERDLLLDTLEATKWNKAQAAKTLNWSRMTLYRKLARYRIEQS
jgi:two-component system response regulator HydG